MEKTSKRTSFIYSEQSSITFIYKHFLVGLFGLLGFFVGGIIGGLAFIGLPQNQFFPLAYFPQFLGVIIGLFLANKFILNRTFIAFFTTQKQFSVRTFFLAAGLWFALSSCVNLTLYAVGSMFNFTTLSLATPSISIITSLLPISIFFAIQTLAEELIFRSWLTEFLGLFKLPFFAITVITSFLFSAIHASNPEMAQYGWVYLGILFLFGAILSTLVYKKNGLEASWGVHWINNMYAYFLVSYPSSAVPTNSLFQSNSTVVLYSAGLLVFIGLISVFFIPKNLEN